MIALSMGMKPVAPRRHVPAAREIHLLTIEGTVARACGSGTLTLDLAAPHALAGSYRVETGELARGPACLVPPIILRDEAGDLLRAQPGLWACDVALGVPVFALSWTADEATLPGETGTGLILTADRKGEEIRCAETLRQGDLEATATSAPFRLPPLVQPAPQPAPEPDLSPKAFTLHAGRMNRLTDPDLIEVLSTAVPQVDGSAALDLKGMAELPAVTAATSGKREIAVDFLPRQMKAGWGEGEYFYLPLDPNDDFVVEPGRNHRKVYVTNGPAGLTAERIAAEAGVAAAAITGAWLKNNPAYGDSEARPLAEALGRLLWSALYKTDGNQSHWYLMERGHDYLSLPATVYMAGETELHPILFDAWGDPARPAPRVPGGLGSNMYMYSYIVARNIHFRALNFKGGQCIAFENIEMGGKEITTNGLQRLTLRKVRTQGACRRVEDGDYVATVPGYWEPSNNRYSGLYASDVKGFLAENMLIDHAAWEEGYDPHLSTAKGQPPSSLSHGFYGQFGNRDLTFRDVWVTRSASQGLQIRSGGRLERAFVADNNVVGNMLRGDGGDGSVNYSIMLDTVATEAGNRGVRNPSEIGGPSFNTRIGAVNWGWDLAGHGLSVIDSMTLHAGDPDNPDDRRKGHVPSRNAVPPKYFDNSVEYGWEQDIRAEGKETALDGVTIRNLSEALTGSRDLGKLYEWAYRQEPKKAVATALEYFQGAAGFWKPERTTPATINFIPDDRGEGSRWDSRINWDLNSVPIPGDTVNLNGNRVMFGATDVAPAAVNLGGGLLDVNSGRLHTPSISNGRVILRDGGQLWTGGAAGIDYTVRGGRLYDTTPGIRGNMEISGTAEVVFGEDATIPAGRTLLIHGGRCCVGWDGTGSRRLAIAGTLDLRPVIRVLHGMPYDMKIPRTTTTFTGETSGFVGTMDPVTLAPTRIGSSNVIAKYFRGATALPLPGERMVGEGVTANGSAPYVPAISGIAGAVTASFPVIRPFRSGMSGTAEPSVTPIVVLSGPLHLRLLGMTAGSHVLIDAAIAGTFSDLVVSDLDPALNVEVKVAPSGVTMTLAAGSGQAVLS